MLATIRYNPSTMYGGDQDVRDCLPSPRFDCGPGFLNLNQCMQNGDDDGDEFDVDLTILDFLVYKATGLIFEWKESPDPFHSDLPNALVSMTAGKYHVHLESLHIC